MLRIIARLNVGGPARHVVWLTEGLASHGFRTTLVSGVVPPGEDDMGYFASEFGIAPLIIPEMSREISPKDILTTWKLYRLMQRERPDIVHTHTAKAGTVGRVAGLMYRCLTPGALMGKPRSCRFVHTYHGHVFHSYYGPFKTKLFVQIERWLARLATDRIIVISEQQRREINETFRVGHADQFRVIPLGIDLSAYTNWEQRRAILREELNAGAGDLLIGIVGRLTQIKHHRMFLGAAERLVELMSRDASALRVRFVIIGDGHLRAALESQAAAGRIKDHVIFLGSRDDPENFYPGLDIVALTSLNEGTPLTLIEAMANARPVIATAVGGVVDLLGPAGSALNQEPDFAICERGVRVSVNDPNSFAKGLRWLVQDQSLRGELGKRGLAFVNQNHPKDRLINDVANLYREFP